MLYPTIIQGSIHSQVLIQFFKSALKHYISHMRSIILNCILVRVYVIVYLLHYYDNLGQVLAFFRFLSIGSSLLFIFITNSIETFLAHFIAS